MRGDQAKALVAVMYSACQKIKDYYYIYLALLRPLCHHNLSSLDSLGSTLDAISYRVSRALDRLREVEDRLALPSLPRVDVDVGGAGECSLLPRSSALTASSRGGRLALLRSLLGELVPRTTQ